MPAARNGPMGLGTSARRERVSGSTWEWGALAAMAAVVCLGCTAASAGQSAGDIDVCKLVSATQVQKLYRKPLYPTAHTNECQWSEKPGGMADMDIHVIDADGPLRDYFAKPLPSQLKLVEITDLGDEGLMSVGEGTLGVVEIRKGKRVLQSAVTFLDIEPGSDKQAVLWDIYRAILKQM